MENHLPGQLGFPTTEIQQGNKGSPAARSPIASASHGDSESLQAGVRVGRQKLLTGWLVAGHVHKDEDGKISNKEESEHSSLLSRRNLRTIGAAVDWMGILVDRSYQVYVGHTAPIPTNRFIECSSVNITGH